ALVGRAARGARLRRLTLELLELLLQLARLVGELLQVLLHARVRLVERLIHLGERGELELEARAVRHPAAADGVVVVGREAERRALTGQQSERRRVPVRGHLTFARLAREVRERDVRPRLL